MAKAKTPSKSNKNKTDIISTVGEGGEVHQTTKGGVLLTTNQGIPVSATKTH